MISTMPSIPSRQTMRSPILAALLSLIAPGLGQLYNGERAKGAAVLCIALFTWFGIILAAFGPAAMRSRLTVIFLALAYVSAWIPAAIDAYQRASGTATPLLSHLTAWYVILMLVTVGPMALPLLWQSRAFSRKAKIVWTVVVIGIALLFIVTIIAAGPTVEQSFQQYPDFPKRLR